MKHLYVKQKVFSLQERFTVMDQNQQVRYRVEGSFLRIPKKFDVTDERGTQIAVIEKKLFQLLPVFAVDIVGQEHLEIKKHLTFFKARYSVSSSSLDITGDWWNMDFEIRDGGHVVGSVHKKWISWGDTYELSFSDERYEHILVALVVAIDCVKKDEANSANSSLPNG